MSFFTDRLVDNANGTDEERCFHLNNPAPNFEEGKEHKKPISDSSLFAIQFRII